MAADGADAILVSNPANITYLTGLARPAGYLFITQGRVVLVTDPVTVERAEATCPGLATHPCAEGTALEAAAELIRKAGPKAAVVEARHLTLDAFERLREAAPKVSFKPLPDRIEALRALKDPSEVEEIRAAVRIAERAFRMFAATLREADTERDMRDALDAYVRRSGGWDVAFPTLVAVGDRGAAPDPIPGDVRLAEGSKLLVDFGVTVLYRCRLTRTVRTPFGVTPTRRTKRERLEYDLDDVFAAVVGARDAAVGIIRDGVPIRDADTAAREVLRKAGLIDFAPAAFGHGIGLEAVEGPVIRAGAEGTFQSGMVICLGAGVRIPGWGSVKWADPTLVTRDRAVPLTTTPPTLSGLG
ncbi:MAG: aminopeptidase family protein [Gemmataceae bacterium]|nr:aminopeptidase family protein [Gemmataceae bacterium]